MNKKLLQTTVLLIVVMLFCGCNSGAGNKPELVNNIQESIVNIESKVNIESIEADIESMDLKDGSFVAEEAATNQNEHIKIELGDVWEEALWEKLGDLDDIVIDGDDEGCVLVDVDLPILYSTYSHHLSDLIIYTSNVGYDKVNRNPRTKIVTDIIALSPVYDFGLGVYVGDSFEKLVSVLGDQYTIVEDRYYYRVDGKHVVFVIEDGVITQMGPMLQISENEEYAKVTDASNLALDSDYAKHIPIELGAVWGESVWESLGFTFNDVKYNGTSELEEDPSIQYMWFTHAYPGLRIYTSNYKYDKENRDFETEIVTGADFFLPIYDIGVGVYVGDSFDKLMRVMGDNYTIERGQYTYTVNDRIFSFTVKNDVIVGIGIECVRN